MSETSITACAKLGQAQQNKEVVIMNSLEKLSDDYNRLMYGENYEIIRVKNPVTDVKGHGAESSFVFLREISGKTITQINQGPGHDLEHGPSRCKSNRRRKGDGSINLRPLSMATTELASAPKGLLLNEKKHSIREAALLLGVGQTTLRTFMKKGLVPVIRLDGKLMFLQKDLEEFIKTRYGHVKETPATPTSLPPLPAHIANSPYLKRK